MTGSVDITRHWGKGGGGGGGGGGHIDQNEHQNFNHQKQLLFQVWDENLATEAAQWTKNCIYEFRYGSHGENMYYFETKLPDNILVERAIDAWYSERYSWRMSGDCAEACSYTQVLRG